LAGTQSSASAGVTPGSASMAGAQTTNSGNSSVTQSSSGSPLNGITTMRAEPKRGVAEPPSEEAKKTDLNRKSGGSSNPANPNGNHEDAIRRAGRALDIDPDGDDRSLLSKHWRSAGFRFPVYRAAEATSLYPVTTTVRLLQACAHWRRPICPASSSACARRR
jgi:hypothetical protein